MPIFFGFYNKNFDVFFENLMKMTFNKVIYVNLYASFIKKIFSTFLTFFYNKMALLKTKKVEVVKSVLFCKKKFFIGFFTIKWLY
jgi:hypothetical protein